MWRSGFSSMLLRQGRIELERRACPTSVSAFTPEVVEARTGVKANVLAALARHNLPGPAAPRPCGGNGVSDP